MFFILHIYIYTAEQKKAELQAWAIAPFFPPSVLRAKSAVHRRGGGGISVSGQMGCTPNLENVISKKDPFWLGALGQKYLPQNKPKMLFWAHFHKKIVEIARIFGAKHWKEKCPFGGVSWGASGRLGSVGIPLAGVRGHPSHLKLKKLLIPNPDLGAVGVRRQCQLVSDRQV